MPIRLVPPDVRYRESYLEAAEEFGTAHRDGDGPPGIRADLDTEAGFDAFVAARRRAAETPLEEGHVTCTFLWIVDDEGYAGSLAIRHELTDFLRHQGGHIGYSVRPSRRRRGYATEALRQALPIARHLGIARVLVTCDEGNTGSRRVIEANGGVLEDVREGTRRSWIDTRA